MHTNVQNLSNGVNSTVLMMPSLNLWSTKKIGWKYRAEARTSCFIWKLGALILQYKVLAVAHTYEISPHYWQTAAQ